MIEPSSAADQAGDHVEHGGLAGAVRAEQADGLAAAQFEADAAHDGALLEGLNTLMNGQPAGIRIGLGFVLKAVLLGLGNPALGDRLATLER